MWLQWIWEGFVDGVLKVVHLWWLILLFIGLQFLKESGWLDRVSRRTAPLLKPLRLPGGAALPIVAATAVGVTYGAGIIIQVGEEGTLTRNQLTTACVLVGICHAVFEETILLTAAGANGLLLLAIRAAMGILFAFAASRILLPPVPACQMPERKVGPERV